MQTIINNVYFNHLKSLINGRARKHYKPMEDENCIIFGKPGTFIALCYNKRMRQFFIVDETLIVRKVKIKIDFTNYIMNIEYKTREGKRNIRLVVKFNDIFYIPILKDETLDFNIVKEFFRKYGKIREPDDYVLNDLISIEFIN